MIRLEDRQILVRETEQARTGGARLAEACALAGLDAAPSSAGGPATA